MRNALRAPLIKETSIPRGSVDIKLWVPWQVWCMMPGNYHVIHHIFSPLLNFQTSRNFVAQEKLIAYRVKSVTLVSIQRAWALWITNALQSFNWEGIFSVQKTSYTEKVQRIFIQYDGMSIFSYRGPLEVGTIHQILLFLEQVVFNLISVLFRDGDDVNNIDQILTE